MAKIPIGSGMKAGWGFLKLIKLSLFALFFAYILISAISTGIKERDLNLVLRELGEEFLSPVISAQEVSLEIQNNNTGFMGSLWDYWGFYSELFKIYLWIYVLKKVFDFLMHGTTPPILRIGLAAATFGIVQLIYITWILKEDPSYLLMAFKDILEGIISIFSGHDFTQGKEAIISPHNSCNESVCTL